MNETPKAPPRRHKRLYVDGTPVPLDRDIRCGWAGDDVGFSTRAEEVMARFARLDQEGKLSPAESERFHRLQATRNAVVDVTEGGRK